MDANDFVFLQKWYINQCDGDWEHKHGIKIETVDNPGWCVTVDLEGTCCENKMFKKIKKEASENVWYHCFVRDGKFEGAGGPCNLVDILSVFQEWVKSCQIDDKK